MKSTVLGSFVLGTAFGIGMTFLCLYSQRPGPLAASIETISAMGRARRARAEEREFEKEWLKRLGYSDEEIDEVI